MNFLGIVYPIITSLNLIKPVAPIAKAGCDVKLE